MSGIGVALLGYGLAGSVFHAPLISVTPGLELRAIVTGNPERRARATADFPDARLLPDAGALWEDHAGIGLAVVATPNHLHAPQAISALERGLAVVVDKPMALSTAEASSMLAAAARTGGVLAIFHNRRWDSDFLLLREMVSGDRLGGLLRVEARFERFVPEVRRGSWREQSRPEAGGGLLLDLGSHLIDQALLLLGPAEGVYAEISSVRAGGAADDDCFVALSFPGGAHAHLWMTNLAPSAGPRWRAWGRRAALEVWGLDPQETYVRAGGHPGDPQFGEPDGSQRAVLTAGDGGAAEEVRLPAGRSGDFYAGVAAAIRGEGPVPVPGQAGWDVLAVVEAARLSATTGRVVRPAAPG
ncbi:MAG TPA: Gfo/Idh/MocA family oxidoreductase [Candidatus Binatia bacterium]|nr:Gfo/Idh/MocA family oxidoreductase [Candidatus Binatia bacterium]